MPLNKSIKKVMVIGSGPIIIGQAAEFDYAGTQACRTLRQENIETVLVNSNPATIMTDADMASRVYLEPLQLEVIQNILLKEGCDSLLASLGGQTGLNLAMELAESGFLEKHQIRLLGTSAEGIKRGEDRECFRDAMLKIDVPCIPSGVAHNLDECRALATKITYPLIVRPAFTLGGTGGGIVHNEAELCEIASTGLEVSRVHQVLIEKAIVGWKEIEYEAIRDAAGNAITICSMENFDPVGVHTGDSIVMAPALTLDDGELESLRTATLRIVHELKIEGGCNVQFALHPTSGEYAVIEVNPRLSRSSALASKATGYPIAKVATKIALGYRLDEIRNEVTGSTWAAAEPVIDYIVTKIPKWPFDKFVQARRNLGTQMKATGEVMAIADTIEGSILKAVRSLEQGFTGLLQAKLADLSAEELLADIALLDDLRLFYLAEALRRNIDMDLLFDLTKINRYFLTKVKNIVCLEDRLRDFSLQSPALRLFSEREATEEGAWELLSQEAELITLIRQAAYWSFSESLLAERLDFSSEHVRKLYEVLNITFTYRTVDTCAGEFSAKTPYYYGTLHVDNREMEHPSVKKNKGAAVRDQSIARLNEAQAEPLKKVLVLGSGPIRIGQGIEFDYCSVHCVQALKALGYQSIIINNNPETVSTDFDTSDRLYFEPLTIDDVRRVLENERPDGVICQFGGQTAIKLIKAVSDLSYPILGTSADGVDQAEDRERFDQVLEACQIPRPKGSSIFTVEEARKAAHELGYPVLLRPSYVLGGQGMMICHDEQAIDTYMEIINRTQQEHPVLVDKYLMGTELEVDAVCDGSRILIPGIMEHLERAGVHSGDSISIFPAYISARIKEKIITYTEKLALALQIIGLINIQFILYNDELYVLEVNPRSSRTVPYISKVTGLPIVDLATRVMLGEKIVDFGLGEGLYANYPSVYAIKAPVFSFEKLHNVDTTLGPEMKSTGEVLGLSQTYSQAMYKAILASGFKFPTRNSGILMSVCDADKADLLKLAERLYSLGFDFYATGGTANYLNRHGLATNSVKRFSPDGNDVSALIRSSKIKLLINTAQSSRNLGFGFMMRRLCIEHGIATITSLDTLVAVTECLENDLVAQDLAAYTIADFAEIVAATRTNTKPVNEMNPAELEFLRGRL